MSPLARETFDRITSNTAVGASTQIEWGGRLYRVEPTPAGNMRVLMVNHLRIPREETYLGLAATAAEVLDLMWLS